MHLRLSEARQLILEQQLLRSDSSQGIQACLKTIEQLAYVQIDAIHRIERAHHHILWSRQADYQTDWLNQLLDERQIFEYWGHAASYLPLRDYRYYLPRMHNFLSKSNWAQGHLPTAKPLFAEILRRIADEGPLSASDFKSDQRKGGTWWNWKPAKVALELLYWQGELMVCRREGFKKVYQLREHFLPAKTDIRQPEPLELAQFQIERALQACGIATLSQINRFLALSSKSNLAQALQNSSELGLIQPLEIEGQSAVYYAFSASLKSSFESAAVDKYRILSPFDSLIIQRDRLAELFDFRYIFEAYVPAAKRQHGYFVLPVLGPEGFVSRLDCKADRQQGVLKVLNRLDESGIAIDLAELEDVLQAFAIFNGCESWQASDS